ncbi:DUF2625 family protein [Streptomyces griseorubens]|uniref:DUF2625 family protein n=1 Tax=Streptomyces griseorubens TaxID=66897 RepID=UPI0009983394|nr:DUF2625 family protein [Streptomyces griseorubens]
MREVDELINVDDPAWPLLVQELSGTDVPVEVLPGDAETGRASLLQLQVSARSNLGGIVLNSGGLLVDSGWLRIFGSPGGEPSCAGPPTAGRTSRRRPRPSRLSPDAHDGATAPAPWAIRRPPLETREAGPGGRGARRTARRACAERRAGPSGSPSARTACPRLQGRVCSCLGC